MSAERQDPSRYRFDAQGRFVIEDYDRTKPFASFLPGIAGQMGIPLWVFTANRGQAIASFGVEDKDHPIMEFVPANQAYQNTSIVGFRTFLKLTRNGETVLHEPFASWNRSDRTVMSIGMNDLELQATSQNRGVRTNVVYFVLTDEPFAGLARQVTVVNVGDSPVHLEILDGMPRVIPHGVDNWGLKEIGRTLEAWMGVSNLAAGIPFYQLQATPGDTTAVESIEAGHFYLAFTAGECGARLLPALVDPAVVFGQNTTLSAPDRFVERPLSALLAEPQITTGRTPCGFFGLERRLEPGDNVSLYAIIGHAGSLDHLHRHQDRIGRPEYVAHKREDAARLARQLTDGIDTRTASPLFDAYCRQTLLDNILRGGWPLILAEGERRAVYHIYSRKHGDLERDYNAFYLAAEPYSQGNGNYRDVNQNRRCDVLFEPRVQDTNVLSFLELIQADGYNPLVVQGSRFVLPAEHRAEVLALVTEPEALEPLLAQPFTPGGLLRAMIDRHIHLRVSPEAFVVAAVERAEQRFEATFGTGYWIDHWFYNLDLIETYLVVYPDRRDRLLFDRPVAYFDSPAVVQPRAKKYVLANGRVRQDRAVVIDEEKAAQIAARTERPNLVRTASGEVYRTTVMAKLVGLALLKFATLDPLGMGIEMEAGKPGWYDALNGLPGLFGSSLCETYELERLLTFLLAAAVGQGERTLDLPQEQGVLLRQVEQALIAWHASSTADRNHLYWDAVATARETYRAAVRFGFSGQTAALTMDELSLLLDRFRARVRRGIARAVEMNDGLPPTYFAYTVTDYELVTDAAGAPQQDEQGRSHVRVKRFEPTLLPLFLEGPVHALRVESDLGRARQLYAHIRASDLFDQKLGMYKVNGPLQGQSHEIGRARAFTPGWLENESIWLHMEYKYLLEVLRAGLHGEFFQDLKQMLIPFQDPAVYGRSPLENSSFLVSSAHPDGSLHGNGFVARLSGATAEFLSIWNLMLAGERPFFVQDGELCLAFRPVLPAWLFDQAGTVAFMFLGHTRVIYHNPERHDISQDSGAVIRRCVLYLQDERRIEVSGSVIAAPYAELVRTGEVNQIKVYLSSYQGTGS